MLKKKIFKLIVATMLASTMIFMNLHLVFSNIVQNTYAEEQKNTVEERSACLTAVDFVKTNLKEICMEYNKNPLYGKQLKATSVEFSTIISIFEEDCLAALIDFDGDNGYMIIDGNNRIYDIQTSGDFPKLRTLENISYSYTDGFLNKNNDNNYSRIEQKNMQKTNSVQMIESSKNKQKSSKQVYTGQEEAGDGQINPNKISEYVAERYPGFTFHSSVTTLKNNFDYESQYRTSFYIRTETDENGSAIADSTSEGNCVLNAIYMALLSWQKNGYISGLPTNTINFLPLITSDPLYDYYGTGIVRQGESGGNANELGLNSGGDAQPTYYRWNVNTKYLPTIPTLYYEVRRVSRLLYDYTPESGFLFNRVPPLTKYITNTLFDNDIDVQEATTITAALENINSKAVFLGINNSSTYKNHGVVIVGYHVYKYTYQFLGLTFTKYNYFYELADCWNLSPKIFDPNTSANPSLFPYCLI